MCYPGEFCLSFEGTMVIILCLNLCLFCRVLDVQRSVSEEMKDPLMGIQNQDRT